MCRKETPNLSLALALASLPESSGTKGLLRQVEGYPVVYAFFDLNWTFFSSEPEMQQFMTLWCRTGGLGVLSNSVTWCVVRIKAHLRHVCKTFSFKHLLFSALLRSRQLFHTTYKMYMVSLVLQVIFLLIMCINYGKYANDGIEDRGLETFGTSVVLSVQFCDGRTGGKLGSPSACKKCLKTKNAFHADQNLLMSHLDK